MKSQTAFNHLQRFERALKDAYSQAKSYKFSVKELCEVKNRIYKDSAYSKCPGWVHSHLSGMDSVLFADIQQNWIVWGVWEGDTFVSKWENYSRETKDALMKSDCKNGPQNHYWLELNHKHGKTSAIEGDKLTKNYIVTKKTFK